MPRSMRQVAAALTWLALLPGCGGGSGVHVALTHPPSRFYTPTVAAPVISLPEPPDSQRVPWKSWMAYAMPADSCAALGHVLYQSFPPSLSSLRQTVYAHLKAAGYERIQGESGSSSGPGYSVEGTPFRSKRDPNLTATVIVDAVGGSPIWIGYWVIDILPPRPGHHCMTATSGTGASQAVSGP